MSQAVATDSADRAKRGALYDGALSDEALDSSEACSPLSCWDGLLVASATATDRQRAALRRLALIAGVMAVAAVLESAAVPH